MPKELRARVREMEDLVIVFITGRIPRLEDKTFLEQIGRIREGAR